MDELKLNSVSKIMQKVIENPELIMEGFNEEKYNEEIIHKGLAPLSFLTGKDEDKDKLVMQKHVISQWYSDIAKIGHKKSPRSREFYSKIGKLPHKRGGKHKKEGA